MSERRQLRIAQAIKRVVSETILNNMSDPRITGLVSVTEVKLSPDLREAAIFLSIYAETENKKKTTFKAIEHARGLLQTEVAHELDIRFCPKISLHMDEKMQKTMETMKLIDKVAEELKDTTETDSTEESQEI